ncbi:nuclease-related domain-containing protein [Thermoleptolyngbya sichuanensis XZ-Cy5]|uniref:nuclease-related domain-containing protein n=1 Tax=Thermoleptolyngbya sichuanensis TaxID=2885951 RepID=UPI00240E6D72|nr:nuclease-related domain-containing protein [Thermoleptolyngbya sichuanensis]MDG2614839.1 nuclease-related domain-containing protein [Thermoleptolyngbya sichuanensis XZ-Cy5]
MGRKSQAGLRAGQNVRKLALKRRVKAIFLFVMAGLAIASTISLHQVSLQLSQLTTGTATSNQSSQSLQFSLSLYLYHLSGGAIALGAAFGGLYLWKRAGHADQGAQAEEAIAKLLNPLIAEGWQIEYGLWLGKGLGDADVVCLSPRQQAFVIDVKSHRGTVVTDGVRLLREFGAEKKPFEKDFLRQVKRQAVQVKSQKNWSFFVAPILAFSTAKVALPSGKIEDVYVVEAQRLVDLLRSLVAATPPE